ncbi:MAG: WYL domain-containing protein [Chloroflexota bacterium]|nr:MAG: WYL domain-containing protein [Chloroflexota bacterium]
MLKLNRGEMRADRLLSILILLQNRGRLPARELAAELEVSERTIYRDMDALSSAGVPVYTERGPGGGCSLLESFRTDLTGLTRDEVRALFMLSIPTPLTELGVDQNLKAALLKLSAALPEVLRPEGARAHKRIHLDSSIWFHQRELTPHIHTIHQALWEDTELKLTIRLAFEARGDHLVEPYGLVAKANTWYLVCARQDFITVVPLPDVIHAESTGKKFVQPADFDLVEFWTAWCLRHEENRPIFPVQVAMSPDLFKMLTYFHDPILSTLNLDEAVEVDGKLRLTLYFDTFEQARKRLLDFGGAVMIIAPESLRESVRDYADQIRKIYEN